MYNEFSKPTLEIELIDNRIYIKNILKICNLPDVKNIILITNNLDLYNKVVKNISNGANIFSPINNLHILDAIKPNFNINDNIEVIILSIPFTSDLKTLQLNFVLDKLKENFKDKPVLLEFSYHKEQFNVPTYNKIIEIVRSVFNIILLGALFKSTELIMEHPCNAYLCDGNSCHSEKSSLPRYLYISERGIDPYKSLNEDLIFMKNIRLKEYESIENYFKNEYINTNEYKQFINKNKQIYNNYIINPIVSILPWNLLMN